MHRKETRTAKEESHPIPRPHLTQRRARLGEWYHMGDRRVKFREIPHTHPSHMNEMPTCCMNICIWKSFRQVECCDCWQLTKEWHFYRLICDCLNETLMRFGGYSRGSIKNNRDHWIIKRQVFINNYIHLIVTIIYSHIN